MIRIKILLALLFPVSIYAQVFKPVIKATLKDVGFSSSITFDADKDGLTDILVMGKNGTDYFTKLLHNNGDSTFLDLGLTFPGLANGSTDIIDYNNDGLPDIVFTGFNGEKRQFCLFRNGGNNLFTKVNTNIPGVDYSTVKSADLNRDGWSDIILAGQSDIGKIFKIYKNNGNGTFMEINSLEGIYDGSFDIADINKDSYPDIVACGVNNSFNLVGKIYINTQNGFSFSERTSNIPAIRGGKLVMADYNNDGYADAILTGQDINNNFITEVYQNNSGITFSHFTSLSGLFYSTMATGDFNNDGYTDILISGLDASFIYYKTICYMNNSGNGFMEQATNLPDFDNGSISPLNLISDDRLDVLVTGTTLAGPISKVYYNDIVPQNVSPKAPTQLTSFSENDSVILRWKAPNDDKTSSKALTYDFYIKADLTGDTIYASPSDYVSGKRYIYEQGVLCDTFVVIKHLPYGKYTWSVQAVDQSYRGSAFASEEKFNICYDISIGADTVVCKGSEISLTAGESSDVVEWYSSHSPTNPLYTGNTINLKVANDNKVWATVTKPIGCVLTDTIYLETLSLPETSLKDTSVCQNSEVLLSLAHDNYKGDWSSRSAGFSAADTSMIVFRARQEDEIYVKITNTRGCVNFDTTKIKIHTLPVSNLPTQVSICSMDTFLFTVKTPSVSAFWYNSSYELIAKGKALSYPITKSEKIYLNLIDSIHCVSRDSLQIQMFPLPLANAGRDTLICSNTQAQLGGYYSNPDYFSFQWFPSMGLNNDKVLHPLASPLNTTTFVMKVTDNNACSNYDTVIVRVNPKSIIDAGGEMSICYGNSVELGGKPTASGGLLPYKYEWIPSSGLDNNTLPNPKATPVETTKYRLVVSTAGCPIDTSYVNVNVWQLPIISKSSDVVIGDHESTNIWASGGTSYLWEPATGLDNSIIANPVASPTETTVYKVKITDDHGCVSTDKITVTVKNEIFVPNLFTPNGDGNNDYFKIYGTGINKINLKIYSAEGILVFETTSIQEAMETGWDGKYRGFPLPPGKYLWILEETSREGTNLLYNGSNKGIITLLR